MTPRPAIPFLAAALAAAALAAPAGATPPPITASQITSPSNPAYVFGEQGSGAHAMTVTGTTTGGPDQQIDLKCYDGSGYSYPVKTNVRTIGNTFSLFVTQDEIATAAASPCVLRAVPAGDSSPRPPSASADPYTGPRVFATVGGPYVDSATGQAYDFAYNKAGTAGTFQFNSAESGISPSYLLNPSTLAPTPSFIGPASGFNGGDLIKVDGVAGYLPYSAYFPGYGWFGIADIETSLDPATGELVIQDHEPLSKLSDSTTYDQAGVELDRTWTSDGTGQVAHEVDTWRSTDGQPHTIQLQYEGGFAAAGTGNNVDFPGTSGYRTYATNDQVTLPSGPGTIYFKQNASTPAAGDGTNPQGALTYAEPPDGPLSIEYSGDTYVSWTLPYTRTIPAGGSSVLRFTWSQAFALGTLQSIAGQALADYAPAQAAATPSPPPGAITSNPLALPQPGAPQAGGAALSLIGGLHPTANGVSFTVACADGPCIGAAALTSAALLKGSKLTGVTSARAKRRKIVVGSTKLALPSGTHRTIVVKLNGSGLKLLKRFKKLPATLTLSLNGRQAVAKSVALKPAKKKH